MGRIPPGAMALDFLQQQTRVNRIQAACVAPYAAITGKGMPMGAYGLRAAYAVNYSAFVDTGRGLNWFLSGKYGMAVFRYEGVRD